MMPHLRARRHLSASFFSPQAGFTLIELMVTIAIATLLMTVAVPNFVAFQRNARLSDAVSNFIGAANAARANGMKQGLKTYLVPNSATTGWSSGWMVYADANWNEAYDAASEEVILRHDALSADITVEPSTGSSLAGSDPYLMFNGSGYPRLKITNAFGGGTIKMSNTSRSSSIVIDAAGRVRSCKTNPTGC